MLRTPAPRPFRSTRTFAFPVSPEQLWGEIEQVDRFATWWPWLEALDATGLVEGDVWDCRVQPPLPWSVRFLVTLDRVEAPGRADATVTGDIRGTASLVIEPATGGSQATLTSCLAPASALLQTAGIVARPLIGWGHDWILDAGARQFGTALASDPTSRSGRPPVGGR